MDCVTCLLVGMCMLCGRNFGAANPGRPMTRAEVDTALQSALRKYGNENTRSNSYRRPTKLDPRFGHMGIGKRYSSNLDPYHFSFGLGKRSFQESTNIQDEVSSTVGDLYPLSDATVNFNRPGTPDFSEDTSDVSHRLSLPEVPNFNSDGYQLFFQDMMNKARTVAKNKQFLDDETRKLQLRRQKHRLESLFKMTDSKR